MMEKVYYVCIKEDYDHVEPRKSVSLTFTDFDDVIALLITLNHNKRGVIVETELCSFENRGD